MKVKTSELTGKALNWAVDQCKHKYKAYKLIRQALGDSVLPYNKWVGSTNWPPSTNWAQGGPIIEAEGIEVGRYWNREPTHHAAWKAQCGTQISHRFGPTPLIAAMRCLVASKLGDDVEIPEELK